MTDGGRSTTAADRPILEVHDLTKHFHRRSGLLRGSAVRAVEDVSFTLARGRTLGLVGESGCGKSTTGRLVTRLIPPTSGRIAIDGVDVTTMDRRRLRTLRRKVQIVFQDPLASLDRRMSVGDSIAEPLHIHGIHQQSGGERRVEELLGLVGLRPRDRHRLPHEFSGGQRQRICIARALALRPELLVLDEPVSALDVSVQAQIVNLLTDLQEQLGVAYLFIAHDLSVVRHISHEVAVMYLGRIVEHGESSAVFDHPQHPYTTALLSAVPIDHPRQRGQQTRIVLTGDLPDPTDPPSGCAFRSRCWRVEDVCAAELPELVSPGPHQHASRCLFRQTPGRTEVMA